MAVSSFQKPPATQLSGATVSQVSGAFSIDLSSANTFFLDLDESVLGSTQADILLVGQASKGNSGPSITFNLVSEVSSDIRENDLVLVAYAHPVPGTFAPTTSGYTLVGEVYIDDSSDTNLSVYYKIMGATPDTSLVLPQVSGGNAAIVSVWRNVDTSSPLDNSFTSQTFADTMVPNPPAITTITDNAVVVAIGAGSADDIQDQVAFQDNYDLTKFMSVAGTSNDNDPVSVIGQGFSVISSAGSADPANDFAAGGPTPTSSRYSAAAITIALRPIVQSGVIDTVSIDFTNIPNEAKEFSVFLSTPSSLTSILNSDTLYLNWDSSVIQITPLTDSLVLGTGLSEQLIGHDGILYSNTKKQKETASAVLTRIYKKDIISSTSTWTCPSDVSSIELLLCGGGSGGGRQGTNGGPGGSGSAYYDPALGVTPGTQYSVVIGAGGASISADGAGNPGSSSYFGNIECTGGQVDDDSNPGLPGGDRGGRGGYPDTVSGRINNGGPGFRGFGGGGGAGDNSTAITYIGIDGGGRGGSASSTGGTNGSPHSGAGGGGAELNVSGSGGSGICIIEYWSAY